MAVILGRLADDCGPRRAPVEREAIDAAGDIVLDSPRRRRSRQMGAHDIACPGDDAMRDLAVHIGQKTGSPRRARPKGWAWTLDPCGS